MIEEVFMFRKRWRLILVVCLLSSSCVLLYPQIHQVRNGESWAYYNGRFREIGLAFHNYYADNIEFPAVGIAPADRRSRLSWRVDLLPYIEQDWLWRDLKHDEPWDNPHNKALLD